MERDQALKFMHDLLRLMLQKNGSDLFITTNFPPAIKIDGKIVPQSNQQLTHTHTSELARVIMSDRQAQEFEATKECNFAISPPGIGRFRANAFIQQGQVGLVLRTIPQKIPTFESLGLPPVLKDITMIASAGMLYAFKFVWAPLLDHWQLPGFQRLGRRRGWLLAAQLGVIASLLLMAATTPAQLGLFIAATLGVAFFGATQDIAVDAYRIEIAPVDAQGALVATYSLGYRIGLILAGALAAILAATFS